MIEEIEIDGYRLLKNFKADFKSLNVIIGANATGKSSLIDCLLLIRSCCELPLNTVCGNDLGSGQLLTADGKTTELHWKLTFRRPARGYLTNMALGEEALVYEVALKSDTQGRVLPNFESLRNLKPFPNHENPLKFLEATPHKRQIFDRKVRRLISFDEVEESATSSVNEPSANNDIPPDVQLQQNSMRDSALLLSQMHFRNEYPVLWAARYLLAGMTFYPGFDVTRSSILRTRAAEIRPVTFLIPTGGNLGTVLHEIFNRYDFREAATNLREYLRTAFPVIDDIWCETTYGTPPQILVRLREKHAVRHTEIWELSDGMLRFLCLAAALLNPVPAPMIAIDEPELGLHPKLLPIVSDMIKEAAERTQVLITTHSPELLDCFDIHDIAVMSRGNDELRSTWHRPSSRKGLVQLLSDVTADTLGDLHRSGELEAGA